MRDDIDGQNRPIAIRSAVLVTSTELEPRTFGKQVVLGGLLDHLVERLGPDAVHVVQLGRVDPNRPDVPYRRHLLALPSATEQVGSVLRRVVLGRRSSLQEAALWSRSLRRHLAALLADLGPDLEIWDTMRVGQYALELPGLDSPVLDSPGLDSPTRRRVLYADDLFSKRYATMLDRLRTDPGASGSPLGEFAKLLPGPARRIADLRLARRLLLGAEQRLVTRSEDAAPARFDTTLLVNPTETEELSRRSGSERVRTLLPMVTVGPGRPRQYSGEPTFVFLGGLDFPPNREGLRWFLTHCRAAVLNALPQFRLLLVGRGTDADLPEREEWGEHVQALGWVDDLDEVLGRSAALLSPLWTGSGLKIKVLESIARGLPVVGTAMGVLGLDVDERDGCLVADTPDGLAAALAQAAEPAANAELSARAARCWSTRYAPEVLRERYDDILGLRTPAAGLADRTRVSLTSG